MLREGYHCAMCGHNPAMIHVLVGTNIDPDHPGAYQGDSFCSPACLDTAIWSVEQGLTMRLLERIDGLARRN